MVVLAIIFIIVFLPEIVSGIVVGGLALLQVIGAIFGHEFSGAHDALTDVTATKECYFELKRRGIIQ